MGINSFIWENPIADNIALNHNGKPKSINKKLETTWIREQTGLATALRRMPDSTPHPGSMYNKYQGKYEALRHRSTLKLLVHSSFNFR